ncbi:hypothetical protein Q8A67_011115 [Cirrhinus molitorella]|uniref:Uncharacterized protein n=1 Tax=Cirrhinus molitorella TaxID=172907 RepID=A0AA88PU08_9TELE|nr:hypothetical protein Q8A67_011115 [Cirrhinus molitorella]
MKSSQGQLSCLRWQTDWAESKGHLDLGLCERKREDKHDRGAFLNIHRTAAGWLGAGSDTPPGKEEMRGNGRQNEKQLICTTGPAGPTCAVQKKLTILRLLAFFEDAMKTNVCNSVTSHYDYITGNFGVPQSQSPALAPQSRDHTRGVRSARPPPCQLLSVRHSGEERRDGPSITVGFE